MFDTVPRISAADGLRVLADDILLIDVREQNEWDAGHAPEARHLPLSSLRSLPIPDHQGRRVLVICRSGVRSIEAAAVLIERGCDALSVDGGMRDWQALGGTVVNADGDSGVII